MAKIVSGVVNISGTYDDSVYSVGKGNKKYIRKKQKPGLGKDRPAIVKQNSRTGFLNSISGSINRVIKKHNPVFHESNFYERMNKRLRTEPADNRFLLLMTLKNIEVNTEYPLHKLNFSTLTITGKEDCIEARLQVTVHPGAGKYVANCYDYELMLISWNKTEKLPDVETQLSPWIFLTDPKPVINFIFNKRADITHWVLFIRQRLGKKTAELDERYVEAKVAEGMQLVEVGSFDVDELKLFGEKQQAITNTKRELRQVDKQERKGVINYESLK